jgi:hypothetical protein
MGSIIAIAFIIFCERKGCSNFNSASALFFHVLHYQKLINSGNPTQSTCDCAPFILHISTSIELEGYIFKLYVLVKKPNMNAKHQLNVPLCLKIAHTPFAHTWYANHNTFVTIVLHIL